MADDKKVFDAEKFNTDPAFETERTQFDAMFAGSFARFMAAQKAKEPTEENFFDRLFSGKKAGE